MKNPLFSTIKIAASLLVIVGTMLTLLIPSISLATTPIPHQFYGDVLVNGSSAPDGTTIEAKIDGAVVATNTTTDGVYGSNPNIFFITDPDGNRDGDIVSFFVDGVDSESTAVFSNGTLTNLDLTITEEGFVPPEADTTAPAITLLGEVDITLTVGDSYTDAGATALDETDGDITESIVVDNPVDTSVADTYTVTYSVQDDAGNKAEDKIYHRHTGFPGGLYSTNFTKLQARFPGRALEKAVKGMLPKGPLGYAMIKKMKVYAGNDHQHSAQQPQLITIK